MSATAEPKPIYSILHLSDLHLGASFADVGGKNRRFLKSALRRKAYSMQAHDDFLLLLLPMEIARIGAINRARFQKAWSDQKPVSFDKVVISGDISTDVTDEARFAFAHGFITSKSRLAGGVYGEQASIGLGLSNDTLLCVPGNHDKMRETTLTRFNSSFSQSPERCNYVRFVKRFDLPLVFIGMDSNSYAEGNIANGEMDPARLSWLADVLNQLETTGVSQGADSLTPSECGKAIKCLLIHHHVCDLSWKRYFSLGRSFTRMNGAKRLLKLISGKVHLILHGHEHYPTHFVEKESKALVISAGTTSQWQSSAGHNSFYNLIFYDNGSIQIEEFIWNGKGFTAKETLTGKKRPPVYELH